jgi:hypothetical protein
VHNPIAEFHFNTALSEPIEIADNAVGVGHVANEALIIVNINALVSSSFFMLLLIFKIG